MVRNREKRTKTRTKRAAATKKPLLRRIWNASPVIAVAILLTFIFSHSGLLRKFETSARDTTMFLKSPRLHNEVAIVRITDEDYKELFGGKSPLEVQRVKEILQAIALGKPKLIGVDLDTSAPDFAKLQIPSDAPATVWARTAAFSNVKKHFRLFDVLGGANPLAASGLVLFKQDEDGAVRRYTRSTETDRGPFPSLPWAIIKKLGLEKSKGLKESNDEFFINYVEASAGSGRVDLPASEILRQSKEEGYQTDGVLKDKIVLLGGDYAVQDEHDTPLGWMLGVHALSQIIETELEGGGVRPASTFSIILLELIDGFVLLVLFQLCRLNKALMLSVLMIPFLALVCSLVAFRSFAHWAYFVPILLLIIFHQLYERGKEYFKKLPEQVANNLSSQDMRS